MQLIKPGVSAIFYFPFVMHFPTPIPDSQVTVMVLN